MESFHLWAISISISSGYLLLFVPVLIYYAFRFEAYSTKDWLIMNRYPSIVKYTNVLVILISCISNPIMCILRISPLNIESPQMHTIIQYFQIIIFSFMFYGTFLFIILKYWLICYDLNLCLSNIKGSYWKRHLNPKYIDHLKYDNFWIRHKRSLGSYSFMIKICIIIWIILWISLNITIMTTMNINSINALRILCGLHLIVIIVIFAGIYIQLPSNLDVLYVRYEIKITVCTVIVAIIMIAIFSGFLKVINIWDHYIAIIFWCISSIIIMTAGILTQTFWILRKGETNSNLNSKTDNNKSRKKRRSAYNALSNTNTSEANTYSLQSAETDGIDSMDNEQKYNDDDESVITLNDILMDEHEFVDFVEYLCKQFCIQIMLCFVEMVQLKNCIDDRFEILNQDKYALCPIAEDENSQNSFEKLYHYDSCNLKGNESIPVSFIVYEKPRQDGNEEYFYVEILYDLYWKYVKQRDENEFFVKQIPKTLRRCYEMDMDMTMEEFLETNKEMNIVDAFQFYDKVIEHLFQLMQKKLDGYLQSHLSSRSKSVDEDIE